MGSLALLSAAVAASLALIAGPRSRSAEGLLQRLSVGLVALATLHVVWLLIDENTSYDIVVDHTRPGLSTIRRVMGLWGGSAGSLLLFTLVLGGVLVAAPVLDHLRSAPSLVLAVLAWTSFVAASPFERLDNPAIAGSGLSPILEHWAMIIHPPLLYLGLALSLVPAIVGPTVARRWAAAAISVLTLALALGGGWAYVELGWGGWYAWDPVENAALIPWLLLVASMHLRADHVASRWLSLLVWPTVFAGTAMTRTSLRTSVHAFANSDGLGWTLWPLAAAVSVGALVVGISIQRSTPSTAASTRWRLVPVVLVGYAAVVVALGTFRPFIPGEATDGTFFARFLFPATIAGLLLIGIAPRFSRPTLQVLLVQAAGGFGAAIAAGAVVGWSSWWQLVFAGSIGAAVVLTVGGGVHPINRTLAHLGMICVLAGALGGTASISQSFPLDQGESIDVHGHTVTNNGITFEAGPPAVVTASVMVDGIELRPALTVYPERRLRLPEVATKRRAHEDFQLILRSAKDDGHVQLTANIEPLTQLVWLGALLIALAFSKVCALRANSSTQAHRDVVERSTDRVSRDGS